MITSDAVTRQLLKVVPAMMRAIRKKWKKGLVSGVTDSQFHILMAIRNNPGASLLEISQHLGQTPPSTSASVEELVAKQLVTRESSAEDRRKITLVLTNSGETTLQEIFEYSQKELAPYIIPLTQAELETVFQALVLLEPLFITPKEFSDPSREVAEPS
jgi:DNA-binding MarR family transcriptional regulator